MIVANPFTPVAGRTPPVVAGRESVLALVERAMRDSNAPQRNTVITGTRGIGKTVVLRQAERFAATNGWVAVGVSASDTMAEDALDELLAATDKMKHSPRMRISELSATFAGIGVKAQRVEPQPLGWHTRWRKAMEALKDGGVGLLLTIDEIQPGNNALKPFFTFINKLTDEGYSIIVMVAGLPEHVEALRNRDSEDGITFIQRARLVHLEYVSPEQTGKALAVPAEATGRSFSSEALGKATDASDGFPYLIQLIGYHAWDHAAVSKRNYITTDDVEIALAESLPILADDVITVALRNLSQMDMKFLHAMLQDDGESKTSDIAERLKKPVRYVGVYRTRLIEQNLIRASSHGRIEFAFPGLAEYLRTRK